MTQLGITLLWCIAQVTLLSVAACGAYLLLRRFGPKAGALVILTSMSLIVGLSLMMFSPWPSWTHLADSREVAEVETPAAESDSPALPRDAMDQAVEVSSLAASAKAQPELATDQSTAMLFLNALGDELSRPRPVVATASSQRWPMVLVGVISVGLVLGLTRLLGGLIVVRSYRHRSETINDPRLTEMVDVLLAELGCRRRLELRESDALVSAATVGWRCPLILLPRQWRDWSDEQLRAVLAHELAHIVANDFLTGLLGQIGLALHFYHPVVHWLMARLRLEQELAADGIAATLSGGRRIYLTTIATMALEQEDHNVGWPARAFLPAKSTFLRRISMLRDKHFRIAPVPVGVRATSVAVMLLLGLAVVGLRPSSGDQAIAEEAVEVALDDVNVGEMDLAYVPDDAVMVGAIRPAGLIARLEELGLYEVARDIVVFDRPFSWSQFELIEQVTIASSETDENPSGPLLKSVFVTRYKDAGRRDELVKMWMPGFVKKTYGGNTYYDSVSKDGVTGYWPDDRTFVCMTCDGDESDVRRLMDLKTEFHPVIEQSEAWQGVKRCYAAAIAKRSDTFPGSLMKGVSAADVRELTPQEAMLVWSMEMTKSIDVMAVGAHVDSHVGGHVFGWCDDEDSAEHVKELLEGLVVIGRSSLKGRFSSDAEGNPVFDTAMKFLDSLRIDQAGPVVHAAAGVKIEKDWAEKFADEVIAIRRFGDRSRSAIKLMDFGLAMHSYYFQNDTFPPPVLLGPDGKTPYSWRVALLPFLGERELYDAYDFNEPWDGPNNRTLLDRMPTVFRHPTSSSGVTTSAYYAITGPETAFEGEADSPENRGIAFPDITDGTSETLMLVEARRDIPWTKPEDIPYVADQPLPKLGGFFEGGFHTTLCDGSVLFLRDDRVNEKTLRAIITKAGGERLEYDAFESGLLDIDTIRVAD